MRSFALTNDTGLLSDAGPLAAFAAGVWYSQVQVRGQQVCTVPAATQRFEIRTWMSGPGAEQEVGRR
jgi:hypothetical protein